MQRATTFIAGLVVGAMVSGSLAVLRAQSAAPIAPSVPSSPAPVGRYQLVGGTGIQLVDTTNGETFQPQASSDGKGFKWGPFIPPLVR